MVSLRDRVLAEVGEIVDFETGMTFGEMKMIRSVRETEPGVFRIDFTPSSPVCPMVVRLAMEIRNRAENIEGVKKALVYCRGHVMEEKINRMVNT